MFQRKKTGAHILNFAMGYMLQRSSTGQSIELITFQLPSGEWPGRRKTSTNTGAVFCKTLFCLKSLNPEPTSETLVKEMLFSHVEYLANTLCTFVAEVTNESSSTTNNRNRALKRYSAKVQCRVTGSGYLTVTIIHDA